DPSHPLRDSAHGPRTDSAAAFQEALAKTDAVIRPFAAHNVDLVSVVQLEMFVPHDVELAFLKEARSLIGNLPAFWEAPPERTEQTIALLAELNSDVDEPTFGFKLRTGGV